MTQKEQVLEWLQQGNSITSWDAIQKWRITRLGAVIQNLEAEGYKILSTTEHNEKTHWTRYRLKTLEELCERYTVPT